MNRRTPRVLAAGVALGCLLAGCGSGADDADQARADYCETVTDRQAELSEIMAERSPASLLEALPVLRDLADVAPRDVTGDWELLLEALTGLQDALADADVDPAAYDAAEPPEGVSRAERRAIAEAADELLRPEVAAAFEGVQQHAKDVCQQPLYR